MNELEKVEAMASVLGNLLNNNENCLKDEEVKKFVDKIYKSFIENGNINILSKIIGFEELNIGMEELNKRIFDI